MHTKLNVETLMMDRFVVARVKPFSCDLPHYASPHTKRYITTKYHFLNTKNTNRRNARHSLAPSTSHCRRRLDAPQNMFMHFTLFHWSYFAKILQKIITNKWIFHSTDYVIDDVGAKNSTSINLQLPPKTASSHCVMMIDSNCEDPENVFI